MTPNIRIEFPDSNGPTGRVWIRQPDSYEWIDVSSYVTGVQFTGSVDRPNTATVTFHRAATGAP